ncbi:MAG: hypothetical protein ACKO3T_19540 [Planctomycetaceae bacterium]
MLTHQHFLRLAFFACMTAGNLLTRHTFAADPPLQTVHSLPAWVLQNDTVSLAVTKTGGHMAPVTFDRSTANPIQPYYISPWQDETRQPFPAPVLKALRGDFFCLPFGGNNGAVNGESHPPHGEIAGTDWKSANLQQAGNITSLTLTAETLVRPGKITKTLLLKNGHNVVYSTHLISGFAGPAPLGHHATLAMPDTPGSVRITTSPIKFGMTCPGIFSEPQNGEYQRLQPGQRWASLTAVPQAWKNAPDADLTRLPGPAGYADLVQIFPATPPDGQPAWVTATFPESGYLWFSMKNPAILNSTVFWMEHHGRHGFPWNGRNNCLGLEDVTAFFAAGLKASAEPNELTKQGIATAVTLQPDQPTAVHYLQGAVRIPAGFDAVASVEFSTGKAVFHAASGITVTVPVDHQFVLSGKLSQ